MKADKIMVVDRDPAYGRELCRVLEEMGGFRADCATDSRAAMELATGFYPYLAVIDVLLPDGDGFDLCTELQEKRPMLPVLFLCADEDEVARLRGLGVTPEQWLMRSEAREKLAARAQKILQRTYEHVTDSFTDEKV